MAAKLVMKTFGYKHRPPPCSDSHNFDCRYLRNPWKVPVLRNLDGTHSEVQDYVRADPGFASLSDTICLMWASRSGEDLVVSLGCYGGKHRSVACAEIIASHMRTIGVVVEVEHAELGGEHDTARGRSVS